MDLAEVVKIPDVYFIAETPQELCQEYIAASDLIFCNVSYKFKPWRNGYLKIYDIEPTVNYLIFYNSNNQIQLSIYRYIPETYYVDIVSHLSYFQKQFPNSFPIRDGYVASVVNNEETVATSKVPRLEVYNNHNSILKEYGIELKNNLVDITDFTCPVCNAKETIQRINQGWEIIMVCPHCDIRFRLHPSKYYVLHSREILEPLSEFNYIPQNKDV